MSVTNNLSEDYSHPNNHARQTFLELFIALEFQVSFQENSQFSCSQPYRNISLTKACVCSENIIEEFMYLPEICIKRIWKSKKCFHHILSSSYCLSV